MDLGGLAQILGAPGAAAVYGKQRVLDEREQEARKQQTLEAILASEQRRRFGEQEQPLKLEGMGLENQQRRLGNEDQQFKNDVNKTWGVDGIISEKKATLREKHVKNDKDAYEVFNHATAFVEAAPQGLAGEAQRRYAAEVLQRSMGMPADVAQRMVNTPGALAEMSKKMYERSRKAIEQEVKGDQALALQNRKNEGAKTVVEIRNQGNKEVAQINADAKIRAQKLAAGAKEGSRAKKDPTTFEGVLVRLFGEKTNLDPSDPNYGAKLDEIDKKIQLAEAYWTTGKDTSQPPKAIPVGTDANGKPIYGPNREAPPTKDEKLEAAKRAATKPAEPPKTKADYLDKNGSPIVGYTGVGVGKDGKRYKFEIIDKKGNVKTTPIE